MAKKSTMKDWGHDKTSFSNLPQEVHHVEYPYQESVDSDIDDTMEGIDEVVDHSKGRVKKHPSYQK